MRSLAMAALAALFAAGSAVASPSAAGRTEFEVLRNGQPFGRHTIVVSRIGNSLRAETSVALAVRLGPVVVYRYEQTCAETWDAGVLSGLRCSTLKDGRRTRVSATREGDSLLVAGAQGERAFPVGALPTSWWTAPPTQATTLIDTQTGAAMPVRVTRMGRETITAGGQRIQADRVRVQGSLSVDLWYDAAGRWVACAFTTQGQNVQYRLLTPANAGPA